VGLILALRVYLAGHRLTSLGWKTLDPMPFLPGKKQQDLFYLNSRKAVIVRTLGDSLTTTDLN
jgi:hypothetical protein